MTMTLKILIATDNTEAEAQLIASELANDYKNIEISIRVQPYHRQIHDPSSESELVTTLRSESSIADFDKHLPDVIILAFTTLAVAEEYYVELYQHSEFIANTPHRTVLLCHQEELKEADLLYQEDHYDDYVVFWPSPYDKCQLLTALRRASLSLETDKTNAAYHELSKQVHRLTHLEEKMNASLSLAQEHLDTINQNFEKAILSQSNNLARFIQCLSQGKFRELIDNIEAPSTQQFIKKLQQELIRQPANTLSQPLLELNASLQDFNPQHSPYLKSIRSMNAAIQNTPMTILIVDDDKFAQMLIKDALVKGNYAITTAFSGMETLKSLRKHKPDLILMDLNMPGMDGIETVLKIKASPTLLSIPIIMITGNNAKKDVIDSLKAGAADFIVKPISHGILLDKIKLLLQ